MPVKLLPSQLRNSHTSNDTVQTFWVSLIFAAASLTVLSFVIYEKNFYSTQEQITVARVWVDERGHSDDYRVMFSTQSAPIFANVNRFMYGAAEVGVEAHIVTGTLTGIVYRYLPLDFNKQDYQLSNTFLILLLCIQLMTLGWLSKSCYWKASKSALIHFGFTVLYVWYFPIL